ncbi:MAG TPA: MFS transporter [Burkholderiales bacterium]|nr:MFS transporter [Burkholderiales bacterium]
MMSNRGMMTMLIALCAATFFVSSAGVSTAPFINLITRDLSTTLPAVAHLFSIQAFAWGVTSLVAGMVSARFGQRAILVSGILLMGVTRLGLAAADTYAAAVVWQILSGIGGGAFMGIVYAAVSEHASPGIRGRAMSWVITGQSLSLVIGVPLVTLLGAFGGWRGAVATHGVLVLVSAIAVRLATPPDPPAIPHAERTKIPYTMLLKPKLIALLVAGTTERMCFAAIAIFLPAYLQFAYDATLGGLALVLALVAAGNLVGNIVGGRIADRTRSKARVFAIGSALTAVVVLPLLAWHPGLGASVALGFVFSFVNAAGRPSLMASLAEVPSELRSALFGLNVTMASMGWLLAGSVGGWLIATMGFPSLGAFCALVAALGCGLALFSAARPKAATAREEGRGTRGE